MTKKNHFFSELQVSLSKEFFREEPRNRIEFENMLEKFGYSYHYEKISSVKDVKYDFFSVSIYKDFFLLGVFLYEDFFNEFNIKTPAYNLLENFGHSMKI